MSRQSQRVIQLWPTQLESATSDQRARMAFMSAAESFPASRWHAFSSKRPGRAVPTMAVWTPGTLSVKRNAVATASRRYMKA
jgi:hypothetical protein